MKPEIVVAATLILMQAPAPLRAQTEDGHQPSQADPCQAGPEGRQANGSNGNAGLSEKLDRCGGVLKPPSGADQEIEKRPPETGSTPVIPPGQLPNRGEPQ
ncbi:hypothetical protein [Rhizobium binxianense]